MDTFATRTGRKQMNFKKEVAINIESAKEHLKSKLKSIKGIMGIGITNEDDGTFCLMVNVSEAISEKNKKRIPESIDGVAIQQNTVSGSIHFQSGESHYVVR